MQTNAFFCDCCQRNLDESKDTAPIVVQLTFGITNLAQARNPQGVDLAKVAMPEAFRKVMAQPVARLDVCLDCAGLLLPRMAGKVATAEGERRALPAAKAKAVDAFVAEGFVSMRPEHTNRIIADQKKREDAERAKQQAGQAAPEAPADRIARLRRELDEAETAAARETSAGAKRTRRATARKATAAVKEAGG